MVYWQHNEAVHFLSSGFPCVVIINVLLSNQWLQGFEAEVNVEVP